MGRDFDEFWRLSPAQVDFVLNANSEHKVRRGTASDMMRIAKAAQPRSGREGTG